MKGATQVYGTAHYSSRISVYLIVVSPMVDMFEAGFLNRYLILAQVQGCHDTFLIQGLAAGSVLQAQRVDTESVKIERQPIPE